MSHSPTPLDLEVSDLLTQLWRAIHRLETLSKRMIKTLGVTGPQRLVLKIVARAPGITAGAVSDAAQVHPSTLTGILERLVRGGFLVRARDADDGRRARFEVTAEGRRLAETRTGTVEGAVLASLDGFSAEERAAIRRWLVAFGDALVAQRATLGETDPG